MSFLGNFLCCTTCYFCLGETGEETTKLGGIFLLEGLYKPFASEKVCISFGETFFPFEDFSFFIYCFEWYGYHPFFSFSLAANTFFLLPIHPYELDIVSESIPFYPSIWRKCPILFCIYTILKSVATMLIEAPGRNGSSLISMASFFLRNFSIPFLIISWIIFLKLQQELVP